MLPKDQTIIVYLYVAPKSVIAEGMLLSLFPTFPFGWIQIWTFPVYNVSASNKLAHSHEVPLVSSLKESHPWIVSSFEIPRMITNITLPTTGKQKTQAVKPKG